MKQSRLQIKLDEIAGSSSDDILTHPQRVEALRSEFNHSIQLKEPQDALPGADCISYALRVPEKLLSLTQTFPEVLEDFMNSGALPAALTKIRDEEMCDGGIVLYFNAGQVTHAGYWQKGHVVSKWGKNPIYEHEITEVPASYGGAWEFYSRPDKGDATKVLVDFIRQHPRYVDLKEPLEDFLSDYDEQIS